MSQFDEISSQGQDRRISTFHTVKFNSIDLIILEYFLIAMRYSMLYLSVVICWHWLCDEMDLFVWLDICTYQWHLKYGFMNTPSVMRLLIDFRWLGARVWAVATCDCCMFLILPLTKEVVKRFIGFTLSVHLSVCPSVNRIISVLCIWILKVFNFVLIWSFDLVFFPYDHDHGDAKVDSRPEFLFYYNHFTNGLMIPLLCKVFILHFFRLWLLISCLVWSKLIVLYVPSHCVKSFEIHTTPMLRKWVVYSGN